jgi:hypothetical protein
MCHSSDEDLSPGTPIYHPSDEDLSPGTPIYHPSDEDLSPGTPIWRSALRSPISVGLWEMQARFALQASLS